MPLFALPPPPFSATIRHAPCPLITIFAISPAIFSAAARRCRRRAPLRLLIALPPLFVAGGFFADFAAAYLAIFRFFRRRRFSIAAGARKRKRARFRYALSPKKKKKKCCRRFDAARRHGRHFRCAAAIIIASLMIFSCRFAERHVAIILASFSCH